VRRLIEGRLSIGPSFLLEDFRRLLNDSGCNEAFVGPEEGREMTEGTMTSRTSPKKHIDMLAVNHKAFDKSDEASDELTRAQVPLACLTMATGRRPVSDRLNVIVVGFQTLKCKQDGSSFE